MEINTRLTILRVLLIVFIGISIFTVGVDYFVLDNVLVKSAQNSLTLAAEKTSERIYGFMHPMESRTTFATSLIQNGNITPSFSPIFVNFLHDIIADEPYIAISFFADTNGNFYLLQKDKNQYINTNIIREENNSKAIINTFDEQMNLISSKTVANANFDARTKMWYQQAIYKKNRAWYLFPLSAINQDPNKIGDASIGPVYDKLGTLHGVFGVGASLAELGNYIRNVEVYPDSIVMVLDDSNTVMAAFLAKQDLLGSNRMPTFSEMQLPWTEQAFAEYKQNKQTSFIYTYNKQKFIGVFSQIPQLTIEHQWYVGIITPLNNVTLPSKINVFLLLIIAIGLVIVIIISMKLMSNES